MNTHDPYCATRYQDEGHCECAVIFAIREEERGLVERTGLHPRWAALNAALWVLNFIVLVLR